MRLALRTKLEPAEGPEDRGHPAEEPEHHTDFNELHASTNARPPRANAA